MISVFNLYSTMTRFDRSSLNVRECTMAPGSDDAVAEEKQMVRAVLIMIHHVGLYCMCKI